MWQLVTKKWPYSPPWPSEEGYDPNLPMHYGADLENPKYNGVDESIKILIRGCLLHNPAHRLSVEELVEKTQEGSTRRYEEEGEEEGDDFIRSWVQKMVRL